MEGTAVVVASTNGMVASNMAIMVNEEAFVTTNFRVSIVINLPYILLATSHY